MSDLLTFIGWMLILLAVIVVCMWGNVGLTTEPEADEPETPETPEQRARREM
jgi:hypothetical protein